MSSLLDCPNRQEIRDVAIGLRRLRASHGDGVFDAALDRIDPADLDLISRTWQIWAREAQLRQPDYLDIWLRSCGRGEGKTRAGSEERLDLMEDWGPQYAGMVLNKTIGDARKVNIQGPSGIMRCAERRGYTMRFVKHDRMVYHPLGGVLYIATPEAPDSPRGFECNDFWADEISSWVNAIETWGNILQAWRVPPPAGQRKRGLVTTTPKPNPIMFQLMTGKKYRSMVTVTFGSTEDNYSNLSPDQRDVVDFYRGTKLGRQENEGELLSLAGATIDQDTIDQFRADRHPTDLVRRVVSVDPSIDSKATSDDAGIAVVGVDGQERAHAYILDAYSEGDFRAWPRRVVESFLEHDCDCVIAEVNQGGGMIADAIQVAAEQIGLELGREIVVPVQSVWTKESKKARAEPVGALYERGRVHHVGVFSAAEKELSSWVPGMDSPNIMDAIVQGVAHVILGDHEHIGALEAYTDD